VTVKLNITETTVPTDLPRGGKTKEANPYLPYVETLKSNLRTEDSDGKALTFDVPRDKGVDDETYSKSVRRTVAKWQEAGAELGITVRAHINGSTVTVWGVPRITRQRKPKDDAAQA
jgi:hypothetical protein